MGNALRNRIQQDTFINPVQEAMLNLLVAADDIRSRMEAVCSEHDLTSGQFNVLRILKGVYPEGHARHEIARRMIERSPDITRLVDRLERRGLVERDRRESDRRLSITKITPTGLELVKKMNPLVEKVFSDLRQRISASDCEELSRICEGLYT